jgi:hypothetical protein
MWCISILGQQQSALERFKGYLNTNYSEFEVVFSITQFENKQLEQTFAKLHPLQGFSVRIDREVFYRVCKTTNGFLCQTATNLSELTNNIVNRSAYGVVSNVYWSCMNGKLVIDRDRLQNEFAKGVKWPDMAYDATHKIFSYGMPFRKGTLKWTGNKFTAETASSYPVPKDKRGERLINGEVSMDSGSSVSLSCSFPAYKAFAQLHSVAGVTENLGIPENAVITEVFTTSGMSNTWQIDLISLKSGPVDPRCINYDGILIAAPNTLVIEKSGRLLRTAGIGLKTISSKAIPMGRGEREGIDLKRKLVILMLFGSSICLVYLLWSRKHRLTH